MQHGGLVSSALSKGGSVYEAGVSEEACLLSSGYAPRRG